ncbi:MAG TPA: N-glycosylase/DNA lyase [Blastocatellia bacterium]|nr:N-glycosylase/DNA lyase [Blastocatellia bacterium]
MGQAWAVALDNIAKAQPAKSLKAAKSSYDPYPPELLDAKIAELHDIYQVKREAIRARLAEFETIWQTADDVKLFEELIFCIFTAGASAKMGINCIERIRPIMLTATRSRLTRAVLHKHRYPRSRSGYIVHTRKYVQREFEMKLRARIESIPDFYERRDFFAANSGIKGIGYKEASHYLRNIGLKGYAILDKHILRSLHQFGVVESPKPPGTRSRYLEIEQKMRDFAKKIAIDFDELDLLLWSIKTGEILK